MRLGVPVACFLLFKGLALGLQPLQLTLQIIDDVCLLLVQVKAALDFPMSIFKFASSQMCFLLTLGQILI